MGAGAAAEHMMTETAKTLPPELSKALSRVTELGSLPEITTRIVQVVEDPRATAHDMHEIVRSDPPLAAKVLKVVNSAFYGLPSQITSLDRAILLLGLSAVKNIALAASLARLFKADAISEQIAARDLWRHSVAVGVGARELSRVVRPQQCEEAFVSGLVHDVGLIVAQQLFADKMREIAETCFNQAQDFRAAEVRLIGADHETFGGSLALRWKFPPGLRYAISSHHEPLTVPPEHQPIVALVYLADVLCAQWHCGFWLTAQMQTVTDEVLRAAGLIRAQLDTVAARLPELTEEAERVFQT